MARSTADQPGRSGDLGYYRDKVVVLTGAGSGIGRSSALAYAAAGARLHLVDIRGDRLQEVRAALDRNGHRASGAGHVDLHLRLHLHEVDCTDAAAVQDLCASVYSLESRVDVLQNGVGVLVAGPVEELALEDWRRVVDTNLNSVINSVHAFVPRMLAQGGLAHLVNVASVAGLVGFPYTAPYTATKFAVVGLSEALSAELYGRGIAVTAVCPGMVRSNLVADGILQLPGAWPRIFQQAFDNFAADPDWLAGEILSAVRRRRSLVVPSIWLGQLWMLKRWTGGLYHDAARQLTRGLVRLGRLS